MNVPILRAAKITDLPILTQFAKESGYGITSLPRNPAILEKKLYASERSFQEKLIIPMHETYQFCLEWDNKVIGISGIISRIGMTEPFFAYHLRQEPHVSNYLGIDQTIQVLHFTRARKKPTEIGSLFLTKPFRKKEFAKLLSFSRFLFIASFRYRFASTVIAELRGINVDGYSPFWEAVGRPFFHIDFPKADYLRTEYHAAIEELFPKHPLYVDLLPEEAKKVIATTHPETAPAKKMLEKQGFKISHYIDLFDGGPHMYAATDEILCVKESKEAKVYKITAQLEGAQKAIISSTKLDFRATLSAILVHEEGVSFPPDIAQALHLQIGDMCRYYLI